jgi:nicotinate-nucleotide adenylyltransferase
VKLGIYGGTFNPIHNAHLFIASMAQQQFSLDRIVFIPVFLPPHKTEPEDAGHWQRYDMVRLAIAGHKNWECSDLEITRGGPSYTVDTLKTLRAEHPDTDFFLIVGSDNVITLDSWREPERVSSMATILAYERPGHALPARSDELRQRLKLTIDYRVINGAALNISSCEIRQMIREKKNVSELVPPEVLSYIQAHGLYQ